MSVIKPAGWAVPWLGFVCRKILIVVTSLPLTIPAGLAGFGLVAIAHVIVGLFRVDLVVPLGLVAAGLSAAAAHRMSRDSLQSASLATRLFDLIVLAAVLVWLVFNLLFSSQHLFTDRDPAVYNTTAVWLRTHQSLRIDKPVALQSLAVPGLHADSLGFATDPNDATLLQAQGAHLMPALQALLGKIAGLSGILSTGAICGAIALLAFYGFGREVIGRRWAAIATAIMALSLPMLFTSRDAYTEPLTMALLFGGFSLLLYAWRSRQSWQWAVAGLVIGAAALARIDVYLAFAGIITAASLGVAIQPRRRRRQVLGCSAWLLGGLFVGGYLAWLDIALLSTAYYQSHSQYILPELWLVGAVIVAGAVMVLVNWRWQLFRKLDASTRRWRNPVIAGGLGLGFLGLASRPLWFIGYQAGPDGVAATRSFSEQTVNWIVWYFGPVITVMAVIAFVTLASRLLRAKRLELLPFTLVLVMMTGLYLIHPDITGDQVWATRRLLPVVLPGIVLLATGQLAEWFDRASFGWRGRTLDTRIIATVLMTVAVVSPLFVSYPFLLRRLYVPEQSQLTAICRSLPAGSIMVWVGQAGDFLTQPTRAECGNQTLALSDPTMLPRLAQAATTHRYTVVIGTYDRDAGAVPTAQRQHMTTVSAISYNEIEHTYKRAPRNLITIRRTVLIGRLQPDGAVAALQ